MEVSLKASNKIIKTKAYRALDEWIDPNVPLNIWINGETGIGKTVSAIDICKRKGMKIVRINISHSVDTYQLIGSMRLVDGNTVWDDGILIKAMKEGYGVILDELDHGNNKVLMELQSIMELEGYTIKDTKEFIAPSDGFFIIATGNSKGDGANAHEYTGTSPLNKAFRDRFDVWLSFDPPTCSEMYNIIKSNQPSLNDTMAKALALFYDKVNEATSAGVIYSSISIRRMKALAKAFVKFKVTDLEKNQAKISKILDKVLNIYDDEFKGALRNVWDIINVAEFKEEVKQVDESGDEVPF
jgi:MoxR-like ATPase